jgi:hypothetical protein
MNYQEAWNKIVKKQNALSGKKEDAVQTMWESVIFPDYLEYEDDCVNSQRKIKIGSTDKIADIVLCKEKKEICIVELKRFELHEGREQLFSYLKQLERVSIGVLVCDKLYVYGYQYKQDADKWPYVEISFEENDSDGISFAELFNSSNFDESKIKKWIKKKNEERQLLKQRLDDFNKNVAQIKNEINDSLIKESLKKYFINERGFTKEEFEKAYSEHNQISSQPLPRNRRYPANERMEKFKDWLIAHKYSPNVANGYASAVNYIEQHQCKLGNNIDIWNASKGTIRDLVRDYDSDGKYAKIGLERHAAIKNGLKRYYEFLS